ncbi:Uncharacterized protein Rs2_21756 [Raphanus sativus]|nr:Uncharacterized protein Rs2_21756 [Raphanus sativus]
MRVIRRSIVITKAVGRHHWDRNRYLAGIANHPLSSRSKSTLLNETEQEHRNHRDFTHDHCFHFQRQILDVKEARSHTKARPSESIITSEFGQETTTRNTLVNSSNPSPRIESRRPRPTKKRPGSRDRRRRSTVEKTPLPRKPKADHH